MLSASFFNLLNHIYGANVVVASLKLLNYSESGARQLSKKPLSEFNPAKFINKISKKNPNIDNQILEKWQLLLDDFINGVDNPDKYCHDFYSFIETANPDIAVHPKYTIGCLAHSDAVHSQYLRSDKNTASIKLLFNSFPHSSFSQEAVNGLTSDTNESTELYGLECITLLIAALDLDLELISNNEVEKAFGLSITKQYSSSGIRPIPAWISNLHVEAELSSKESLYRHLSKNTGESFENIRSRLKEWQKPDIDKPTQPTPSKINDLMFGLNPDLSVDNFISEHLKFIMRSIAGLFNYVESGTNNEFDFENHYKKSRDFLLKKWPEHLPINDTFQANNLTTPKATTKHLI